MAAAWEHGIRYFDTAPYYGFGAGETRLGRTLGQVPRDSFVLSTKVGRRLLNPDDRQSGARFVFDYSREGTLRSMEGSLGRLRTDRIEMALIHDIDGYTHGHGREDAIRAALDGAYPALVELKRAGVIEAIGIGVNEWEICRDIALEVDIDCVLLAGRHTLIEHEAQSELFPVLRERNIGIIAGGPFNSGILATGAVPGATYNYAPAPDHILSLVDRIERVLKNDRHPLRSFRAQLGSGPINR